MKLLKPCLYSCVSWQILAANPVWTKEIGGETVAKLLSYGHRDKDMGHGILKSIFYAA